MGRVRRHMIQRLKDLKKTHEIVETQEKDGKTDVVFKNNFILRLSVDEHKAAEGKHGNSDKTAKKGRN